MKKSHYELLGVRPDASAADVQRAYRLAAKRQHPDAAGGATSAMVRLNQAYATLKDPALRAAYDRAIAPPRSLPSRPAPSAAPVPVSALDYRLQVFRPLDAVFVQAARDLEEAVDDLADDIYDDHYVLRFETAVGAAEQAFAEIARRLFGTPWPDALRSGLNRYRQALRQADDAIEDFKGFLSTYDEDQVVDGRTLLRGAIAMRGEALGHLGRG